MNLFSSSVGLATIFPITTNAVAKPSDQSTYNIADRVNLLHTLKVITLEGASINLDNDWNIVITGNHRLLRAGAKEIYDRLRSLWAAGLPVFRRHTKGRNSGFLGRWSDAHIPELSEKFGVPPGPNKPGKPGYVIRLARQTPA